MEINLMPTKSMNALLKIVVMLAIEKILMGAMYKRFSTIHTRCILYPCVVVVTIEMITSLLRKTF